MLALPWLPAHLRHFIIITMSGWEFWSSVLILSNILRYLCIEWQKRLFLVRPFHLFSVFSHRFINSKWMSDWSSIGHPCCFRILMMILLVFHLGVKFDIIWHLLRAQNFTCHFSQLSLVRFCINWITVSHFFANQ